MEMEDHQYGIADLRHFINARPATSTSVGSNLFTQPTAELINNAANTVHHHHHHQQLQHSNDQLAAQQHLEMLISTRHQLNSSSDQITPMPTPRSSPFLDHHQQHHHQLFRSDSTATAGTCAVATLDMDLQMSGGGNGDGGTGRWPRQETLTLLEIRSRLDPKFKEANQKGPLWDEVSRIMSVDHGYQRSGKKCREKFENLYKYYKKTKEGKAGRQDGKHYRFFRQLEALYGESSSNNPTTSLPNNAHLAGVGVTTFPYTTSQVPNQQVFHQTPRQIIDDSFTPSNSSAFVTSSSDEYCSDLNAAMALKRRGKRSWKAKIKDFIDGQMRKLMEKQEVWLEKMMKSIEHKEQERMMREEEWRKQEAARTEREHNFWEKERAWIEARDAGLMEALHKLTGTKEMRAPVRSSSPDHADHGELLSTRPAHHQHQLQDQNDDGSETVPNSSASWPECEITRLIQLRTSMEPMFVQQSGTAEEQVLWEEIASNMACLGYDSRSAAMCKDKWENINNYPPKAKDQSSKKRKENNTSPAVSSSCFYFQNNESICNNQGGGGREYRETNDLGGGGLGGLELTTSLLIQSDHHHDHNASRPPPDSNVASSTMQGSSFRFFMGDQTDNLWENYGLKLSKGDNN